MYTLSNMFLQVLNMSITASIVLLVILLLRVPLKKAPRSISYVLWAVVLFRLVCPFSFSSAFSLFGGVGHIAPVETNSYGNPAYVQPERIYLEPQSLPEMGEAPQMAKDSGIPGLPAGELSAGGAALTAPERAFSLQSLVEIAAVVWLAGIAGMLAYGVLSQARLRRRVNTATLVSGNVYETDEIAMPFVLGMLRPRIYLPVSLSDEQHGYVLRHEQAHIARRDHVVKPLAFLLLCVYWFNPLLWAAYTLLGKDMELRCDEAVIQACGETQRAAYSRTLLQLSARSGLLPGSPLAFGESGLKARIKNILRYRKPAFWVGIVAAVAATAVGIALLANPAGKDGAFTLEYVQQSPEELAALDWLEQKEGAIVVAKYALSELPESIKQIQYDVWERETYDAVGGSQYIAGSGGYMLDVKPGSSTLYVAHRMLPNGAGGWSGAEWTVRMEYADGTAAQHRFETPTSLLTYGKEQYETSYDYLLASGRRRMQIKPEESIPLALACMDTGKGASNITCRSLLGRERMVLSPGKHFLLELQFPVGRELEIELFRQGQSQGALPVPVYRDVFEFLPYTQPSGRKIPALSALPAYARFTLQAEQGGEARTVHMYMENGKGYALADGVEYEWIQEDGWDSMASAYNTICSEYYYRIAELYVEADSLEARSVPVNLSGVGENPSPGSYFQVRPAELQVGGDYIYAIPKANGMQVLYYRQERWVATLTYTAPQALRQAPALGYANIYRDASGGRIGAELLLAENLACSIWSYEELLPEERLLTLLNTFATVEAQYTPVQARAGYSTQVLSADSGKAEAGAAGLLKKIALEQAQVDAMDWLPQERGGLSVAKYEFSSLPAGVSNLQFFLQVFEQGKQKAQGAWHRISLPLQGGSGTLYIAQHMAREDVVLPDGRASFLVRLEQPGAAPQSWQVVYQLETMTFAQKALADTNQSFLENASANGTQIRANACLPVALAQADRGQGIAKVSPQSLLYKTPAELLGQQSIDLLLVCQFATAETQEIECVWSGAPQGKHTVRMEYRTGFEGYETDAQPRNLGSLEKYYALRVSDSGGAGSCEAYLYAEDKNGCFLQVKDTVYALPYAVYARYEQAYWGGMDVMDLYGGHNYMDVALDVAMYFDRLVTPGEITFTKEILDAYRVEHGSGYLQLFREDVKVADLSFSSPQETAQEVLLPGSAQLRYDVEQEEWYCAFLLREGLVCYASGYENMGDEEFLQIISSLRMGESA